MMEFWNTRSMRERLLILLAGGLVAILLLNILVVRPLRAAQEEAAASVAVAARTLDAVAASRPAEAFGAVSAPGASLSGEQLRSRLADLASQRGLSVSRLQTGEQGSIVIQFDQATAPLLFAWLEVAEREYGAQPVRASVFAESSGSVRASFEFRGGTS